MATSHADTATAGDGAKSNIIVGDTVTVPTAGATGRERVGKKRSRRHGHGGHHGSSKKKRRLDGGGGGGNSGCAAPAGGGRAGPAGACGAAQIQKI